jgi:group II intron reverse transcriptase/maturase
MTPPSAVIDLNVVPAKSKALLGLQARLYRDARAEAGAVTHLLGHVVDRRNLDAAWQRVADADGADTPGPDGSTCAAVRPQLPGWLDRLADELAHGRYRPQAPRVVEIPKPNRPGEGRRLGVLTVRDRVVQTALKQVLEPVLEPRFCTDSFGFRPGRSVAAALDTAVRLLGNFDGTAAAFTFALPIDVADCFDTIDHGLLRAGLAARVGDPAVLRLTDDVLAVNGTTVGRLWWRRSIGLVQGGALSPLLCNLALHPLDLELARLDRETAGAVRLLRYADDLLLLARDAASARSGASAVRQALARLRQAPRAVPSPRPAAEGIDWLGVRLRPRPLTWGSRVEYGYAVPESRIAAMIDRLTEMTTPPSDRIDGSAVNLGRWIVSINSQLRDWRQAYRFADNAPDLFRLLDDYTRERVGRLMHAVTGERWAELRQKYRVRLPRGFWSWEVTGARLVVLSALAPQAPDGLLRKPAWMRAEFARDAKNGHR